MDKHQISEMLEAVMSKVRELVDVNTVVGNPISTPEGITLIPISEVKFGFASGGSEFQTKHSAGKSDPFGGGVGAGVTIKPVAFMVVKDGVTRMINVAPPPDGFAARLLDSVPDIIDRVEVMFDKRSKQTASDHEDYSDRSENIEH